MNAPAPFDSPFATPPGLRALFAPRSIAIVGATDRPGPALRIRASLDALGFTGALHAVNPARAEALGRSCAPSLSALAARSGAPDVALLCVGPERVAAAVLDAAQAGVKGVVAYASGVGATSHDGRAALDVIRAACAENGIAFCGPDCMGILNPATRSTLYMGEIQDATSIGGDVALITQSGSMAIGLLTDVRRFGYSHVISTGAEAVLTAADYLAALADDPATRVIVLFLEAVRDIGRFVAAADRARERGKPVVVLKVGKTALSQQAALGHTGGIAGDARVFSALLARHGCIEVSTLEELTETVVCLRAARRPAQAGIGIVSPSGGHVEYALDTAARAGIDLPALPDAQRAALAATIGTVSAHGNPVDAWGNGDYETNLRAGLDAFAASPVHGAVVLVTDTMDGQPTRPTRYVDALLDVASRSDKPFYLLSSRAGLFRREYADRLAEHGASQLAGVEPALRAIANAAAWRAARPQPPRAPQTSPAFIDALPRGKHWLDEAKAKAWLRACGLATPAGALAGATDDPSKLAAELGFPVALKVIDERIPHRTPYGLVQLDLNSADAVTRAAGTIRARLATHFPACENVPLLVERMTGPGLDLFVGASTDPECGPMLMIGLGGFLLETVRDVVAIPLPPRAGEVAARLAQSGLGRFLASRSGALFGGVEPLVRFAETIGDLYVAANGRLALIELNPVRVTDRAAAPVVLDALIATAEGPAA
ncbi:acetate--CoA ligase family protein [Paraburkholderia caballeronis]|uniref:acetate--CoA ligase family protein n=1 Tax=Paraburkholderia caballeronis TaxID=416943 RepID=UPI001067070C|nr:acetate--CoA ligase family protein [Paraburkholderia caballeronis]TDV05488.1 acyl-CoA synthetase (NDP forming) [Paraburkholderia caballeronis]TDV09115.1 acyl-CoA synthetase (NDP forming) [Paraburkholderia caballeronis]TDV20235.1 acyl-CoA synthetase (NDP forming) [Paraburkholderia caballeronis]